MKTIIAVIFLVFIIVIGMTVIERSNAEYYSEMGITSSYQSPVQTSSDSYVTVTLSGEVQVPGKYSIICGYYLNDAIEKAGGITSNADTDCFNFYLEINKDISIYIPPIISGEKVSLNEATINELTTLDGIGIVLATRISTYREDTGYFEYLEQIMDVEGIGKSIYNKIKNNICL